ncbi:Gfo/Idh/MocA family protein [Hoeflea poritis]|uniref:Gfo/Idh/MocA family oxidoreductase n=1 Tax=Hoeflea poritis TaxID=2993659 RepID=A0ABT4VJW0_9HYPH|nr:Gfo/Idh/MocA family oxidoreductase [Hoeflea poritis]MDA4844440.1 Gfo/Idh/MocA family oxidoreductase [Hoeflea poritis]
MPDGQSETVNIAIAGYGWWGQHMVRRLSENQNIRPLLVIDPDAERRKLAGEQGVRTTADFDAALADPQITAVVLTTPNTMHEAQVVAAAGAGKHVFCEKPLGLTGASARRSVDACEAAGVVLGIGHERRFEPALVKVRALVEEGELGTVMHAEAAFSHDKLINVPAGDWRTSKAVSPAAGMTAMGIHLTDLYISLFGRVRTVQALTANRILGWETGDVVTVQLGFEAGMTASLSAVLATPHFIRFHVFGSEQWVEVRNDTHPDTPGGIAELVLSRTGSPHAVERYEWTDTVVANLEAFAAAIRGEAVYPYTSEELVHNIEVLEAIARSAEEGETVHIG